MKENWGKLNSRLGKKCPECGEKAFIESAFGSICQNCYYEV